MWKAPGSPIKIKNIQILLVLSLGCNVLLYLTISFTRSEDPHQPPSPPPPLPPPQAEFEGPYDYISSRQVLFVGGVPRSGTTLTRSMLDAHPEVYCGTETRAISRVMDMRVKSDLSSVEHKRLQAAGISDDLLDRSLGAFMSEVLLGHSPAPSKYLCNKDPSMLQHMEHVVKMFPSARFVVLVRDGRAVAHSVISRNVTMTGVDVSSYRSVAIYWNTAVARMVGDCLEIGEEHCLIVYYEQLVQDPRTWMQRILEFGGIPWHENVLHHHELIGTEVSLSKKEKSTSQVNKPVNTAPVDKWRTKIPLKMQRTIYKECDMLEKLGYQPV